MHHRQTLYRRELSQKDFRNAAHTFIGSIIGIILILTYQYNPFA